MELGIDKKQIESIKLFGQKLAADPVSLRFVTCLVVLLVGWFSVMKPQAESLAAARKSIIKAGKQARKASELVFYMEQVETYSPHLFSESDPLTLQRYVLDKLALSGARLKSVVPKKTEGKGVFKVVELDLDVTGTYSQLVDLIDRLEHGENLVRLERVRLQRNKTTIFLECTVNGLVKPGKKKAAGEDVEAGDASSSPESGSGESDPTGPEGGVTSNEEENA